VGGWVCELIFCFLLGGGGVGSGGKVSGGGGGLVWAVVVSCAVRVCVDPFGVCVSGG
jgi:hypothetical protein